MQDVPLTIDFKGRQLTGFAVPLLRSAQEKPTAFDIIIDKAFLGTLRLDPGGWRMDMHQDKELIQVIGNYILAWYNPEPGAEPEA
ncbi:MAG TPA: hypothetical protein VNR87_15690 [Flavisolibacter sp.]|nr:hypothetical protein [Flavisolibacter sp.]